MKVRLLAGLVGAAALLATAPSALASPGDDATIVVEHRAIPAGGYLGVTVDCGPGRRAIGGGAASTADINSNVLVSGPLGATATPSQVADGDVPRYWWSVIQNVGADERDYSFYASCSSNSDATIQAEPFSVPAESSSGGGSGIPGLGGTFAGCPSGERAVGGGLITTEAFTAAATAAASGPLGEMGSTATTEDGDVARYWYAAAVNNTDTARGYTTVAVCSPASTATVQVAAFDLAIGGSAIAAAICPTGTRALGGGAVAENTTDTRLGFTGPTDASGISAPDAGGVARGWSTSAGFSNFSAGRVKFSAICQPDPPARPVVTGATGQRAAALKKCKKKHSRKARKKCRKKAAGLPL